MVRGTEFPSGDAIVAGNMILAAYAAYDTLADQSVLKPAVNLPAPFDLVAWVTMEDFVLTPMRNLRRFYEVVAHDAAANHYVIALRGAEGIWEWWDNVHATFVPFRSRSYSGRVADGFDAIYRTLEVTYVDANSGAGSPARRTPHFQRRSTASCAFTRRHIRIVGTRRRRRPRATSI